MSIETTLKAAIAAVVGRCYPDVGPLKPTLPFATFQQVGGKAVDVINGTDPHFEGGRIQINVWATTRDEANTLCREVVAALRPNPINARPIGLLIARYEQTTARYGAQQDIEVWWHS